MNNRLLIRKPILVPLFFIFAFLLISWFFISFRAPLGSVFLKLLIRTDEAPLPGSFAKRPAKKEKQTPRPNSLTVAGAAKAGSKAGTVLRNGHWNGKAPLAEEQEASSGFIADSCLKNWAVLGPVPLKDGLQTPLTDPVFGAPDHEISCEKLRPAEWSNRIFTDSKGILDLQKLLPARKTPPGQTDAFCLMLTFDIKKAEPRAHILVSYDGLLRVLLDGREIHPAGKSLKAQKYIHEKPFAAPVELTGGIHTLLLKSFSAGKARRLRVRLVGQDDTPLFFTEQTPFPE